MDEEYWDGVRPGDWFIMADRYEGPVKVRVTEVDIKLYEESSGPGYPSRWTHPYGLTVDTGTVKVMVDSEERVVSLTDVIPFRTATWSSLTRSWNTYSKRKARSDAALETFLELVESAKAE